MIVNSSVNSHLSSVNSHLPAKVLIPKIIFYLDIFQQFQVQCVAKIFQIDRQLILTNGVLRIGLGNGVNFDSKNPIYCDQIKKILAVSIVLNRKDCVEKICNDFSSINILEKGIVGAYPPLFTALRLNDVSMVNLLIAKKANVNQVHGYESDKVTPLIFACLGKNVEVVKTLILSKASVNQACNDYVPLHAAAENRNAEITKLLLLNNANVEDLNDNRYDIHGAMYEFAWDVIIGNGLDESDSDLDDF